MQGFESIRVFHSHAPTVPLIAISEAEQRREHAATLTAVASATSSISRENNTG